MWIAGENQCRNKVNFELGKIMRIIDIFFQLWLLRLLAPALSRTHTLYHRCCFFLSFHSCIHFIAWQSLLIRIRSKCRFDRWISVTVTTLRKLLLLFIRRTTAFALVFRSNRSDWLVYKYIHMCVCLWECLWLCIFRW